MASYHLTEIVENCFKRQAAPLDSLPTTIFGMLKGMTLLQKAEHLTRHNSSRPSVSALLVDLSGTLHIGDEPTPDAVDALRRLKLAGIPTRFCSNTSKESTRSLLERLRRIGFEVADDAIHTSLTAVRQLVKQRKLSPLLLLSDSAKEDFDKEQPKSFDSVVVGLAPSKLDYDPLNKAFRILSKSNEKGSASLIATHKSMYFKDNDRELSLGPGGFVSLLEQAAEVKTEVVGKPTRSFFELSLKSLESDGIGHDDWKNVGIVGDDYKNDLGEGAIELGLQRYLVQTGKYRPGDEDKAERPDGVYENFAALVDALLGQHSKAQ